MTDDGAAVCTLVLGDYVIVFHKALSNILTQREGEKVKGDRENGRDYELESMRKNQTVQDSVRETDRKGESYEILKKNEKD